MTLDRYDRQILELLQDNSQLSNQELAERIGLSPSPCLRRVRALEQAGFITGYRALVDARKLGLTLLALVHIAMDRHTPDRFANFEKQVGRCRRSSSACSSPARRPITSSRSIVQDMDAYQALLLNKITRIEGVTGVHSSFVLRT